ncbi:MAG TPA: DUF2092 domain-containing protein, partial [Gemmataceae bacterium]|nr:DUF2092 domain-containing protein [Gemmataceae bacterium]
GFLWIMEDFIMRRRMLAVGLAVAAMLGGIALAGGSQQEALKIEPKADQYLKAMSSYLAGLKTYSFQVEEFFDEVQDDGQKIQFSNQRHLSVSRPNKTFGEDEGDTANSLFYYDGKTATVFDRGQKTYATEKVPGTIDAMLDDLHDRFDTHQTLADFLFADPYKMFTEHVQSGTYVGLHHVGKVKCHHLAFRQRILDWQIWIDAGDQPLPRKLVITFKRQVDQPQYTALIHRWDVNPKLSDDLFKFQPPAGVRKVDFLNRHAEPQPLKKTAGK